MVPGFFVAGRRLARRTALALSKMGLGRIAVAADSLHLSRLRGSRRAKLALRSTREARRVGALSTR